MRKRLLTLVIALTVVLQTAWAYNFSATSPSGHTLYYVIISGTTNVDVVRPGTGSTYDNYVTGNVVIPATVTYLGTTYSVTSIGYWAFRDCSGLTSVTIPNSVTTIEEGAFYYCSGLTSVTIPNSVTSIGEYAFSNCSGLTSVTIPNSVTYIGYNAFSGCSGLTTLNFNAINCGDFWGGEYHTFYNCPIATINIGDSVQTIPANFAYELDSLLSVTIGNSVTVIGNNAFKNCIGIDVIKCKSTIPPTISASNTWSSVPVDINLIVPCGSSPTYSTTYGWSQFTNIRDTVYTNIELSVNNELMGYTEVLLNSCDSTIIRATPNYGYVFLNWNDGNTDNPRTITVTEDATYIANFADEDAQIYTITVLSANGSMGTVSGGGEYEVGTEITITAIPNEGYHFVIWNDGNTDNPRTITVTEDATYIASFEEGVGIESRDMLSELAFYPNPTSGIITFNRTDITKIEVMDAMGKMVAEFENAYTIDISKLAKGYYAMRITTAEGVAVRKVICK